MKIRKKMEAWTPPLKEHPPINQRFEVGVSVFGVTPMIELLQSKITVISGHFGAGKTNIAVNLAINSAKAGYKTALVDLDMVNPYFRSADNLLELQNLGVKAIVPEFANTNVEISTIPPGYNRIFEDTGKSIVDLGGDDDGAVILAADQEKYQAAGYSMYYVYNYFRPTASKPQDALELLKEIEKTSHMRFCGIINNSNLGRETDNSAVEESLPQAEKLSKISNLPLVATTAFDNITLKGVTKIKDVTKKLF